MSRILSCYNDRILADASGSFEKVAQLIKHYNLPTKPTFSEFLNSIETYQGICYDVWWHSRPLHFTLGRDPEVYDRIFTIKQLESFASLVREKTGSDVKMARYNDTSVNLKTKSTNLKKAVATAEDIALIKQKYASDYELYGSYFNASPAADTPQLDKTLNTNPSTSS